MAVFWRRLLSSVVLWVLVLGGLFSGVPWLSDGLVLLILVVLTVAGQAAKRLNERMVGEIPTKYALGKLLEYEFIDGLEPTPLGRAVTRHFLSPDEAFTILSGIRRGDHPYDVVADVELMEDE
jgi:superfamily II helicase